MAEFVTWDQIQPIIYFTIVLIAVLVFFKWRWNYMKVLRKEQGKKVPVAKSIDAIIDNRLAAIPKQLEQVNAEIKHLEKTGANEKQMKSLKDKRRLLEIGNEVGGVAAEIGKPIINNIVKAMKGFGQ